MSFADFGDTEGSTTQEISFISVLAACSGIMDEEDHEAI